jgi:outer membrane protein assembly factor BamB
MTRPLTLSARLRRRATLALGLALAGGLSACLGENRHPGEKPTSAVRSAAQPTAARPALDEAALRQFGFITYWDSFIRDEQLTALTLEGDFEQGFGKPQLYAYTASNRLYQIDMHSGMVNWLFDVGRPLSFSDGRWISEWMYKPELPQGDQGPQFKRYDEVFFVARDHLVALDKDNGSELWTTRLPFGASSPPQASETHVYVGAWDDRIYAFRKDKPDVPDWEWRTDGDVLARSVVASPSLFVPSCDGKLHTFDASSGEHKDAFQTEKRLLQDPTAFLDLLYLPGEDYNLYVLNMDSGLLEYRYCCGAPITTRPVGVDDGDDRAVYFAAGEEGLFALARKGRPKPSEGNPRKTIHELLWNRKTAHRFLCRGARDVYVLEDGASSDSIKITKLGAQDGKEKGSIELQGVDWVLTNPAGPGSSIREQSLLGGIIVVGYRSGWIVALKEIATLPGGMEEAAGMK